MYPFRLLPLVLAGILCHFGAFAQPLSPDSAGTWSGRIDALVVDNFQSGASRVRFFLHTAVGNLELQGAEALGLHAGQMVDIAGRLSGQTLAVSRVGATDAAPAANVCAATGEQKAAVILASFPSKPLLSSVTPALLSASFFGGGRTLDTFLRESSFGQTWVTGDVFGPFVLDADYFDQPLAVRDAALRAAAPFADLTAYNRIFVVAPQGQTGMESGGMALLGCGPISSPQGDLLASSIWMGAESLVAQDGIVDIASHEMGHGFGLEHARFADYGADTLGPTGQAPAPWDSLHEYGDSNSSMGRNSAEWAAPHKALLGWLQPDTGIQSVTASGTFTLAPFEQAGSVRALRIARDSTGTSWIWLEYRQPQGTFDATLPAASFTGALAHYEDAGLGATLPGIDPFTWSNLVSFHPAASPADPLLHAGESWSDPYGNLTLTVNAATPAGLSVSVSYAAAPVCPGAVSGTQPFPTEGGSGQITVTAGAGCSWNASTSVPWITLAPAAAGSGNGNLSFTVASNPSLSARWGKIAVGQAFALVTQTGGSGWMTLTPQSSSFSSAGGTGQFAVATNAPDLAWSFGSDAAWITDIECSCYQSVGPATVRYVVAANSGGTRTATIYAGDVSFAIVQEAGLRQRAGIAWSELTLLDAPQSRLGTALAPFGHSGRAILYGGNWNTDLYADTWEWDGARWTALNPPGNPGLRANHAMTYDEARGQIVLFGGMAGAAPVASNETWIWDGAAWRQMHPATSPPARYSHAMAYDAARQQVVLFGGYGDSGELNDTWLWDGVNWSQAATVQSPRARFGHSLAYDPVRGEMVLFGGMAGGGTPTWFSDTWAWDGSAWHQKSVADPPAARFLHALAWDPVLSAVVMIGGAGGKDVTGQTWYYDFRREVWTWDGTAWTEQFPEGQPGPAYYIGAAWDDARQALTVHVGDDLTCASRGPKTFALTGGAAVNQPRSALPKQ